MKHFIYADNAATTKLDKDAFNAMLPWLQEEYGNASQPYSFARKPKKALMEARTLIAECIGAQPDEIYFTSGGTESDNWAIKGIAEKGKKHHTIATQIEHHAILNANISLHMVNADASNSQLAVYNDIQAGIVNCNQLLMDLGEGEDQASLTAPLRAVRAFYTFLLMDNWGDTPIIDYKVVDNNSAIERSPRAEVAKWIETELLAVRDNCPSEVSESTYGTPTCWMVDALLLNCISIGTCIHKMLPAPVGPLLRLMKN